MQKAALNVMQAIRRDGTQKNVLETMQTRAELYDRIGYSEWEAADRADFQPVTVGLVGMIFAGILYTGIGVTSITREHSSGMIRLTLAATPRRGRVLAAIDGGIVARAVAERFRIRQDRPSGAGDSSTRPCSLVHCGTPSMLAGEPSSARGLMTAVI